MKRSRPDLIDPGTVALVRQLWTAGISACQISADTCIPRRMVRRLARLHGWPDRRRKPRVVTKRAKPLDPVKVEQARVMYADGCPKSEVCWAVGWNAHMFERARREGRWPTPLVQRRAWGDGSSPSEAEEAASRAGLALAPLVAAEAERVRGLGLATERHDSPADETPRIRAFTCSPRGIFRGATA